MQSKADQIIKIAILGIDKQAKKWYNSNVAGVAQSVEQLIRNQQVTGSSPVTSSISYTSV